MDIFIKHSDPSEKYKSRKINVIGKFQGDSRVDVYE